METIKNYVENMFAALPKTSELMKLKSEILMNMEDRYKELKFKGKSENEAIGAVISEFGNLDELLEELEIDQGIKEETNLEYTSNKSFVIDFKMLSDYLSASRQSSVLIGMGVFLCITGTSVFLLLSTLFGATTVFLVPLFLAVAIAVGMFMIGGTKLSNFKFIETGDFILYYDIEEQVEDLYQENRPRSVILITMGVCMCVVSAVFLFIGTAFGSRGVGIGLFLMLFLVAIGVFLFIYNGIYTGSLERLLKINVYEDLDAKKKRG